MEPPTPVSIFYSAELRVLRAEEHLKHLKSEIDQFFAEKPYAVVVEPDADGIHEIYKIKFSKYFPFRWRILATEIIEHARASLDHAAFACHLAARGHPDSRYVAFPFGNTAADFENSVRGRSKDLTTEIQARLRLFRCYKGGNDLLYSLNELCNVSKHALIAFMVGNTFSFEVKGLGFDAVGIQLSKNIQWNRAKNEIQYARAKRRSHFEHQCEFSIFVALQDKELTSAEPATDIFEAILEEARGVIVSLECECLRLGYQTRGA